LHKFKSTPVAAAAVGEAVAAEVAVAPEAAAEEEEEADSRRRPDVLPAPRPGQARRPPAPVLQRQALGLVPVLDPARQSQVLVRPLVLVPRRVRPVLGPVALMSRGAAVPRLAR